jgi:vacuolar-type H+-ATPase subunit I/STV1
MLRRAHVRAASHPAQVNPSVFSIMTFPFLFAVMFGDLGHGMLMLAFALFMVLNEKKLSRGPQNEMFAMAFGGRWAAGAGAGWRLLQHAGSAPSCQCLAEV